jgi:hypothetical protein
MHLQNKKCLILRHTDLPKPPFDLIKDLYKPYKKDLEVGKLLKKWLEKINYVE